VRVCSLAIVFLVADARDSARQLMKGKCREVFLLSLYSIHVKYVLTCNVFYSPQDVALQKLIGTVTELVKEVKELREECQEFFRQSLPSKKLLQPLPVSVPLHNSDELESAEEILASSEARTIMVCGSM
jgi:hypothetical protein